MVFADERRERKDRSRDKNAGLRTPCRHIFVEPAPTLPCEVRSDHVPNRRGATPAAKSHPVWPMYGSRRLQIALHRFQVRQVLPSANVPPAPFHHKAWAE